MTITLDLVLLIAAFICFAIDAFALLATPRINLTALGLALWVLTALV